MPKFTIVHFKILLIDLWRRPANSLFIIMLSACSVFAISSEVLLTNKFEKVFLERLSALVPHITISSIKDNNEVYKQLFSLKPQQSGRQENWQPIIERVGNVSETEALLVTADGKYAGTLLREVDPALCSPTIYKTAASSNGFKPGNDQAEAGNSKAEENIVIFPSNVILRKLYSPKQESLFLVFANGKKIQVNVAQKATQEKYEPSQIDSLITYLLPGNMQRLSSLCQPQNTYIVLWLKEPLKAQTIARELKAKHSQWQITCWQESLPQVAQALIADRLISNLLISITTGLSLLAFYITLKFDFNVVKKNYKVLNLIGMDKPSLFYLHGLRLLVLCGLGYSLGQFLLKLFSLHLENVLLKILINI